MGNTHSDLLPLLPYATEASDMFFMYYTNYYLYMINASQEVQRLVATAIAKEYKHTFMLKPKGPAVVKVSLSFNPFAKGQALEDAIATKRMMCELHSQLAQAGWFLVNSPNLSYHVGYASWMYLQHSTGRPAEVLGLGTRFTAVSLSSYDKIQLVAFPGELFPALLKAVGSVWGGKLKENVLQPDVMEITFDSSLWTATGEASAQARHVVIAVIGCLASHNWQLVNSTCLKADACDCLFFRQDQQAPMFPPVPVEVGAASSSSNHLFFGLALKAHDYLMIIDANDELVNFIAGSCQRHWDKGVRSVGDKSGYPSIFLSGNPWSQQSEKEILVKRFITLLLQDLASRGWVLIESVDCSRRLQDKSMLVFGRGPPFSLQYCCLAPCIPNYFCVVNAPPEVVQLCRCAMRKYYIIEPEKQKEYSWGPAIAIKLPGMPFHGTRIGDTVIVQLALCSIVRGMLSQGWALVGTGDVTNRVHTEHDGDNTESYNWSLHCLWFSRPYITGPPPPHPAVASAPPQPSQAVQGDQPPAYGWVG